MPRYAITVSYDGTAYKGWQVQPNGVTVQELLQVALLKFTGDDVIVHGSGRTDQGVHAVGQVAHFDLGRTYPLRSVVLALNSYLPKDIRVLKARRVGDEFHARRTALSKEYRYFIWQGDIMPAHLRYYRAHVRSTLDVTAMRGAAEILAGEHDFSAFSANPHREVDSNVREVTKLNVTKRGKEIVIVAIGNGFLYKMVRSIAGHLIRVGEGAVPVEETRHILASCERTARVETAQPQGLFLWKVSYPG